MKHVELRECTPILNTKTTSDTSLAPHHYEMKSGKRSPRHLSIITAHVAIVAKFQTNIDI
jgi:hypothetical protein